MLLFQIIPSSLNEKIPFRPDFTKTRNLACYQCISDDMKSPYCANSMLLSAPEEVLVDYMFQCPYGQDEFCLKKIVKGSNASTIRGCYGPTDISNNKLKTGCFQTDKESVCFCTDHLCNATYCLNSHAYFNSVLFAFLLFLVIRQ